MGSHLAGLPAGGLLEAEVDGDSVVKIEAVARHRGSRIVGRSLEESGHVVLTIKKDET